MSAILRQRQPRFESRKLLDLCHGADCFLRIDGVCRSGVNPSVPCHSNALKHGRGVGNKTHDCYAVPGCPECHSHFDLRLGTAERADIWLRAFEEWVLHCWRNGLVRVA